MPICALCNEAALHHLVKCSSVTGRGKDNKVLKTESKFRNAW